MTSSEGRIFQSKSLRFGVGLVVGGAFLYLATRNVSWSDVRSDLLEMSIAWIALALCVYWMELAMRIYRWRLLLSHLKPPVPGYQVAVAFLSGYAVNNVLPAKLGELFRADLLGRLATTSRLTALGSIIVERIFDMLFVLGMAVWGLLFITTTQYEILDDVYTGLTFLTPLIGVLLIGAYILAHRQHVPLLGRVQVVRDKVQNLLHGLQPLRHTSGYLHLAGSTLALWLLNCFAMWAILKGLGVSLTLNQTVLLIGITGITMAIPSAPAGIGTLQYAFHLFAQLLGISASAALAASVIVQVVLLGSATLVGAIAYSYAVSTHLLRRPGEN